MKGELWQHVFIIIYFASILFGKGLGPPPKTFLELIRELLRVSWKSPVTGLKICDGVVLF